MPSVSPNSIVRDEIEAHYKSLFGQPEKRYVYRTKTHSFEVLCWPPHQTGEDVYVFSTLGAAEIMGEHPKRCEFFFGLDSMPTGVADSLAEVALDGNGTGRTPSSGDTATLAFDLWENTRARTYMFTDGGDEIIPMLQKGAAQVEFIQLVPLFPREVEYKKNHGEAALWQHFEANQIAYWDAHRGCAFSGALED